jgi:hypothetical protein
MACLADLPAERRTTAWFSNAVMTPYDTQASGAATQRWTSRRLLA